MGAVQRLGLIAGNGHLPFYVLEEASRRNVPVTVAAIKEETFPEINDLISSLNGDISIYWLGLGQLGRLIDTFKREGVTHALMMGQVKHPKIFAPGSRSPLRQLKHLPDWKAVRILASLPEKNTASLITAVINEIENEGIEFIDSTVFLRGMLPSLGLLTKRGPTREEEKDFQYGIPIARDIMRLDLGQTIVVKSQAVVAVEAMEGTDATIRRASELVHGECITVIKVSRSNSEVRFDVPVIGPNTLEVFKECNVTALAVDAGRTLIIERDSFIKHASEIGLCVMGFQPPGLDMPSEGGD